MQVPVKVVVAVLFVMVGLLVTVVITGLVRDQVDANGLALALSPLITGIVIGVAGRGRTKNDGDDT